MTDPICEFYTNHPYPPPVENLDLAREMYQDENLSRAEFHLLWPHKPYRTDLEVLVAGCGTWQSAKYALCHPAARVVGIDVSVTSLEHTERLKEKYNITNLETRQVQIENVNELGQRFDHIICTGVLHHLVDPDAGVRALRSVLKPDGAMYLMVYAPYGRAGVYMLQDYCQRLGIGTSQEEIDDLVSVLKRLPPLHPLLASQGGSRDFLNGDALADALLNPRDRSYSVPQLFEFIERNDLTLARWYWQAPYLPQCGIIAHTPHAKRLAALPQREQYIEMELWRGLMANHSFVVHRNDMNGDAKVRFDGDDYLNYVPVRLPFTTCVQERLPPGAAGVLLNRTHLFNDLFLIIDPLEKQMLDAVDSRHSIAEIVEQAKDGAPRARNFFEQLWRNDQVVFDTSQRKCG